MFVVRGDELDPVVLAEDASRFRERFAEWGRYGISAFLAASDDEIDVLCQVRLVRFETIVVFRRDALERARVEVVPTFRTPHVTLCHLDLEALVRGLLSCGCDIRRNPYHVREMGMDEGGDRER